jgi:hypothetical protein
VGILEVKLTCTVKDAEKFKLGNIRCSSFYRKTLRPKKVVTGLTGLRWTQK